eukprot:395500-Pyramimonas_sp.AAC.1
MSTCRGRPWPPVAAALGRRRGSPWPPWSWQPVPPWSWQPLPSSWQPVATVLATTVVATDAALATVVVATALRQVGLAPHALRLPPRIRVEPVVPLD